MSKVIEIECECGETSSITETVLCPHCHKVVLKGPEVIEPVLPPTPGQVGMTKQDLQDVLGPLLAKIEKLEKDAKTKK